MPIQADTFCFRLIKISSHRQKKNTNIKSDLKVVKSLLNSVAIDKYSNLDLKSTVMQFGSFKSKQNVAFQCNINYSENDLCVLLLDLTDKKLNCIR